MTPSATAAAPSAATDPRLHAPITTSAIVEQLRLEAVDVVSVLLRREDGLDLPAWEPGAHLNVTLPNGIVRQFSLCGDPADRRTYRIGVLREPASRGGSEYVHMFLRPGQRITIDGPRNNFELRPADRYIFVAGGIGITPILPMVKHVEALGIDWELHYGGRTHASMAFLDELAGLGAGVHYYPHDQAGHPPLQELCQAPGEKTLIYCCGPAPMLNAIEDATAHLPSGCLHRERFAPTSHAIAYVNSELQVRCARAGATLTVPPDRSILSCLEDAGIAINASCREGVCGTCETRVLAGTPEHRDDILTGTERDTNERMFVCVSRATSDELVLDL
jgi:ferredoxin-NADP reductase